MSYGMQDHHKESLTKNRVTLVEQISFDDVKDFLVQEGILHSEDEELISSAPTRQSKMRKLLDTLPRKGPTAYETFYRALERDYPWIVQQLAAPNARIGGGHPQSCSDAGDAGPELNFATFNRISKDPEVMRDWQTLGRCLGVAEADLVEIQHAHNTQLREAVYQTLVRWQNVKGDQATPGKLMEALRSAGFYDIANSFVRR